MGHQLVLIQLILIFLVGFNKVEALFTNYNLSYIGTRNISCALQLDYYAFLPNQRNVTGLNGILNMTLSSYNDFCFTEQINITLRNGTIVSTTLAGAMNGYNIVREYVSGRCSSGQFWPSVTPIGYGTCTRLPYETYTVRLCICSTNNCNVGYSTCVASVQATQSAPPPNFPTHFPDLTNLITCDQGYQGPTYSDMYHGTGWLFNEYTPFNMSAVRAYASSHAVACALYVNAQTGDWYKLPVMYDSYSTILYLILLQKKMNVLSTYTESSTSVSIEQTSVYYTNTSSYWNMTTFNQIVCFCTTNNCNQNLSTCAIGLNASVSSTTNLPLPSTNNTIQTTTISSSSTNTTSAISTAGASATGSPPRGERFIILTKYICFFVFRFMLCQHGTCSSR